MAWCAVESFEREGVCRHGTDEGVREEESDRARGPEERESVGEGGGKVAAGVQEGERPR